MRLHLGFELHASLVRPKGEAVIDLDISAVNGRAVVNVRDLKFNSTSSVFGSGKEVSDENFTAETAERAEPNFMVNLCVLRVLGGVHHLPCNHHPVFDLASHALAKPLGIWLAEQLGQALNQAIADLPRQEERIKKVEIIDIRP